MSSLAKLPDMITLELIRTHVVPISRDGLRTWIREGRFPQPDMRGRVNLWHKSTVADWLIAHGAKPVAIPAAVAN